MVIEGRDIVLPRAKFEECLKKYPSCPAGQQKLSLLFSNRTVDDAILEKFSFCAEVIGEIV